MAQSVFLNYDDYHTALALIKADLEKPDARRTLSTALQTLNELEYWFYNQMVRSYRTANPLDISSSVPIGFADLFRAINTVYETAFNKIIIFIDTVKFPRVKRVIEQCRRIQIMVEDTTGFLDHFKGVPDLLSAMELLNKDIGEDARCYDFLTLHVFRQLSWYFQIVVHTWNPSFPSTTLPTTQFVDAKPIPAHTMENSFLTMRMSYPGFVLQQVTAEGITEWRFTQPVPSAPKDRSRSSEPLTPTAAADVGAGSLSLRQSNAMIPTATTNAPSAGRSAPSYARLGSDTPLLSLLFTRAREMFGSPSQNYPPSADIPKNSLASSYIVNPNLLVTTGGMGDISTDVDQRGLFRRAAGAAGRGLASGAVSLGRAAGSGIASGASAAYQAARQRPAAAAGTIGTLGAVGAGLAAYPYLNDIASAAGQQWTTAVDTVSDLVGTIGSAPPPKGVLDTALDSLYDAVSVVAGNPYVSGAAGVGLGLTGLGAYLYSRRRPGAAQPPSAPAPALPAPAAPPSKSRLSSKAAPVLPSQIVPATQRRVLPRPILGKPSTNVAPRQPARLMSPSQRMQQQQQQRAAMAARALAQLPPQTSKSPRARTKPRSATKRATSASRTKQGGNARRGVTPKKSAGRTPYRPAASTRTRGG